jgi:hypothetical protein
LRCLRPATAAARWNACIAPVAAAREMMVL